jgi:hypothetical protein
VVQEVIGIDGAALIATARSSCCTNVDDPIVLINLSIVFIDRPET